MELSQELAQRSGQEEAGAWGLEGELEVGLRVSSAQWVVGSRVTPRFLPRATGWKEVELRLQRR